MSGMAWSGTLFWTYGKNPVFEKYGPSTPGGQVRFHDFRIPPSLKFHGYGISFARRGDQTKTPDKKGNLQQRRAATLPADTDDCRTIPTVRCHERWVVRVVINQQHYRQLQADFLGMASHRSADYLRMKFYHLPFSPYAPIRAQLTTLLRQVNKARQRIGYEPVPKDCIRYMRKMTSPYKWVDTDPAGLPFAL